MMYSDENRFKNEQQNLLRGYGALSTQITPAQLQQDASERLLTSFTQANNCAQSREGFQALPKPHRVTSTVAGESVATWIRNAAKNYVKIGYDVLSRGTSALVEVLFKGHYYPALYGFAFIRNRETRQFICWSSDQDVPLPVEILFRKRPKKQDVSFAVVFPDGLELTSDDLIDVFFLLILPKGEKLSALFAAGIGGSEGFGGIGFTTQEDWIRACISMCITISSAFNPDHKSGLLNKLSNGLEQSSKIEPDEDNTEDEQDWEG